jgi:uncharacterized protein YqgC (DUF456 family)
MESSLIILWILASVAVVSGLIGLIIPVLPGTPLIFLGIFLAAWAEDFTYVGFWTLLLLGLLAILAYIIDFLAGALGSKKFGASPRASLGAIIGALAGLFFGFAGVVIGPFVGAFLAELSVQRQLRPAGLAGLGAWLGLLVGTAAKIAIGFAMIGIYILMRFIS